MTVGKEDVVTRHMYHWAPREAREEIARDGLLPATMQGDPDGWDYVFLTDAAPARIDEREDLWQVDVSSLELEPDEGRERWLLTHGGPRWWMYHGPVPAERLTLLTGS